MQGTITGLMKGYTRSLDLTYPNRTLVLPQWAPVNLTLEEAAKTWQARCNADEVPSQVALSGRRVSRVSLNPKP